MQEFGIRRVYYSDDMGNLCVQKVSEMSDQQHFSTGLRLMIRSNNGQVKNLPLSKKNKTDAVKYSKEFV